MTIGIRPVTNDDCMILPAFRREMEGGGFLAELRTEGFYRVKFRETGLAFVAADGGRILGVTSATPRTVVLPSGPVPGAELGDLFVHRDARGQGIFRRLHDAVLESLRERGIRLVTVRAGPAAAPLLRSRMGYRPLLRIAEAVATLSEEGRAELPFGRVPGLSLLLPRARERASPPPAPFSLEAGEPDILDGVDIGGSPWPGAGTLRDRERLEKRYLRDPTPYRAVALRREGRPSGGAVLLVHRGRGFLVDLWLGAGAEAAADSLVGAALSELRFRGAAVAHFWRAREAGPALDPLAGAVRRAGLRVLRRSKEVLARRIGDEALTLPPPRDWLFRMGDTDGI